MDYSDEDVIDEFSTFGVCDVSTDVLEKVRLLTLEYARSHTTIVHEWLAFSKSNADIQLSLDNLNKFENEWLRRRQLPNTAKKTPHCVTSRASVDFALKDSVDILAEYSPAQPKRSRLTNAYQISDPVVTETKSVESKHDLEIEEFRQVEILCQFGDQHLFDSFENSLPLHRSDVRYYDSQNTLSKLKPFMMKKMSEEIEVLNDKMTEIASSMQTKYGIAEYHPCSEKSQNEVYIFGRVCCDGNGKLNPKSILLEGDLALSYGETIHLDLSGAKEYSLFPGQVIVCRGQNLTGRAFLVSEILYPEPPLPATIDSPEQRTLSIVVASGPFTVQDNLEYASLRRVVSHVKAVNPSVLLLIGPFIDARNHSAIDDFDEFFKKEILLKLILRPLEKCGTHVILMPNWRDVHHPYIYPQPPFTPEIPTKSVWSERVSCAPDPCIFTISGCVFGVTSTDIMLHLSSEEISNSDTTGDRFSRLVRHLLTQRSFYPVMPPQDDINIDVSDWSNFASIPVVPHVLIVPSDLLYFIKDVSGSLAINPSRATKNNVTEITLVSGHSPVIEKTAARCLKI